MHFIDQLKTRMCVCVCIIQHHNNNKSNNNTPVTNLLT